MKKPLKRLKLKQKKYAKNSFNKFCCTNIGFCSFALILFWILQKDIIISLGTNLGNREENLYRAISLLENKTITIIEVSSAYETPSWGFKGISFYVTENLIDAKDIIVKRSYLWNDKMYYSEIFFVSLPIIDWKSRTISG